MFFENLIEINLPINLEPTNSVLKFKPIPQYFPKSSFSHYSTYLKTSTTFLNASSILRLNIFTSTFLPFSNKYLSYCYMLDTGRGTKKKKKKSVSITFIILEFWTMLHPRSSFCTLSEDPTVP